MASIPDEIIDRVRSEANVVDVIGVTEPRHGDAAEGVEGWGE